VFIAEAFIIELQIHVDGTEFINDRRLDFTLCRKNNIELDVFCPECVHFCINSFHFVNHSLWRLKTAVYNSLYRVTLQEIPFASKFFYVVSK